MQDPEYVKNAFSGIAKRYVITNHILSLGIDILWRKKVSKLIALKEPKNVLDLATGSGDLALEIKRQCPSSKITCSDFCQPMLDIAKSRGLKTVLADALSLPFNDGEFELVSVGFGLRNMANWSKALNEMRRVIKKNGTLVILDFSLPPDRFRKKIYGFYLNNILPLIAGTITRQKAAYKYLAKTIHEFPSGGKMCKFIEDNGYKKAKHYQLSFGIASIYVAERAE